MDTQPSFCEEPEKKASVKRRRLLFFAEGLVFGALFFWGLNEAQANFESYLYADISQPIQNLVLVSSVRQDESPELAAKAALVKKIGVTGRERFVFKKNAESSMPLASLTKLMTAVIILENKDWYAMDMSVIISKEAASQDDVPIFGNLRSGDSYTIAALLELMLQYSSNDAAYALSEVVGTTDFVDKMNKKAIDLKLDSTFFFNPSGLDLDDGNTNTSSAKDIAALCQYIFEREPEIFEITARMPAFLTINGIHNLEFWNGQTFVGGKTGFTAKAGGCMVVLSKDANGSNFINVLLGADSAETRVVEMQKLINLDNN
jgi:D-alanyl-D-alanine carboxypeptidase (penicillin-binding protein 5/6)